MFAFLTVYVKLCTGRFGIVHLSDSLWFYYVINLLCFLKSAPYYILKLIVIMSNLSAEFGHVTQATPT